MKALVGTRPVTEYIHDAPQTDLNLFGLTADPDFDVMRMMMNETHSNCLFVRESDGKGLLAENA